MGNPASAKTMWQPTIPVNQSIYEDNTTQQAPLGARLEVGDRVFFYAQASASLGGGNVVCALPMKGSHQADILAPAATSAGEKVITLTLGTSMASDEYAEGYMMVSSGTGDGITYRIRTHGTFATAATNAAITLYDTLKAPMTATNELNFLPNMYKNVAVGSSATGLPVGVTPIDVTSGAYFWLQTWGPAAPLNEEATPAAAAVRLGTTGGVLQAFNGGTTGPAAEATIIGKNYELAGTAGEETPVFLTLRP